jgi:hypothetical protein
VLYSSYFMEILLFHFLCCIVLGMDVESHGQLPPQYSGHNPVVITPHLLLMKILLSV